MGVERFYIDSDFTHPVSLEETEHHHATRVLRMGAGESLELVNGRGALAIAEIVSISKNSTGLNITSLIQEPPPFSRIAAAVPLMRPSKLEWVIEKGTELGADAFYLYTADHSEKESLSEHQLQRLRTISISAMKQSGRLYLPSFEIGSHLSELLRKEALIFFGDTDPKAPRFRPPNGPLVIFVTGPEQGFSSEEEELLAQHSAKGVRLNPNILRAETAPLAALTIFSDK